MTDPRERHLEVLRRAGDTPDARLDLAEIALALGALEIPDADLSVYRSHVDALVDAVALAAEDADTLPARIEALRAVLVDDYGYRGARDAYDDIRNANVIRVVERRRGLPVALGILYLHVARRLGWEAAGLSFPGHFLFRLDYQGERAILDPFEEAALRGAAEMRELLKAAAGAEAELNAGHYAPVPARAVLLRLQNNVKMRHVRDGDLPAAIAALRVMLLFAPAENALWREAGLLHAHLGEINAAVEALETYLQSDAPDSARQQAAMMIQQLKGRRN